MIKQLAAAVLVASTLVAADTTPSVSAAALPRACHVHRSDGDTYVWQRYARRCRFDVDPPAILIEFDYPREWTNARVRIRCDRIGADFSPVSHHGRNCYDRDY